MTTPAPTESVITIDCQGDALLGILHEPAAQADIGVVVVVGGPQYRAGSHRHFVLLARALAAKGFAVLRFDYRGMGDSNGAQRNFDAVSADIGSAIDALQQRAPTVQRVVLWGLCDGASAALLYMHDTGDCRVAGLCVLNPWVRSAATLARTHVKHYYAQRLRQREFWAKLLRGQVAGEAWRGLLANLCAQRRTKQAHTSAPFQTRMAEAWKAFDENILLVLSGGDYTAMEFIETTRVQDSPWNGLLERRLVSRHDMPQADHTFSSPCSARDLEHCTVAWLQRTLRPNLEHMSSDCALAID